MWGVYKYNIWNGLPLPKYNLLWTDPSPNLKEDMKWIELWITGSPFYIHTTIEMYSYSRMYKDIEDCILQNTLSGDLVIDPMCGHSTTGLVALHLGRSYIGFDINMGSIRSSMKRLGENQWKK